MSIIFFVFFDKKCYNGLTIVFGAYYVFLCTFLFTIKDAFICTFFIQESKNFNSCQSSKRG